MKSDKNFSLLKEYHPAIYKKIIEIECSDSIEIIESKNGDSIPCIKVNDKKLYIHSKFDPEKEADRFISEIDPTKYNLFIVFGFGFAYHIEVLLKKMIDDAILLIVEKNFEIFKMALLNRELFKVLADKRVKILLNPDEDDIEEVLHGKSSSRVNFITHRGSFQTDPEYYSNISEIAKSYLSTKEVNIATLAKFEKIWSANIARNIKQLIDSPGINIFYDKFKDFTAIVVSAGPSLNKSIDFIKQNVNNAVIISVDTAFKILLQNGIVPHFCIAVDPQVINARYFEGVGLQNTILVTDPTVHPSIFRFYKGPIVITGVAFQMMKWIESISGEKGELAHGGSVSTNAYDFAKRLGVSSVIMVGQDLAFTGGYAHAKGSYLDEQIHLKTNRFSSPEMFNRRQLTALPKIYVKGIRSNKVHTNQKMMIFYSWFEKRGDKSIINATYDGAYISGVKHLQVEDVVVVNTVKEDIKDLVHIIYNNGSDELDTNYVRTKLQKIINQMLKETESLIPIIARTVVFSENLVSLINDKKRDRGKLDYILKKLSETDRVIESKKNIKDIISFTIQRVIHTIKEGYDIDEDDSLLNEDELVAKRSQFLYKGLLEGAQFNKKIFAKMIEILNFL